MAVPVKQELILFVDDELAIVKIVDNFLERLGYQVISTTSSAKALKLFKQNADRFCLVITDLTMPEFCGNELAVKIRAVRPDIPIILCTGYGETIGYQRASGLNISVCLGKPITRKELVTAIAKVLDQTKMKPRIGCESIPQP